MEFKKIIEAIEKNRKIKSALVDYFFDEPTNDLAIAMGITESVEKIQSDDPYPEYRIIFLGEVEFQTASGQWWKAEGISRFEHGIDDYIEINKIKTKF